MPPLEFFVCSILGVIIRDYSCIRHCGLSKISKWLFKKWWHVIRLIYHIFYLFNVLVKLAILSVAFTECLEQILFYVFIESFELLVSDVFLLSAPFESAIRILVALLLLSLIGAVDISDSGNVSDMIDKMQCINGRLICVGFLPYLSIDPNFNNNLFLKRLNQFLIDVMILF